MAPISEVIASLSMGTLAHELLVVGVFFFSAVLWLKIGGSSRRPRKDAPDMAAKAQFTQPTKTAPKIAPARQQVAAVTRPKEQFTGQSQGPAPHVKAAQKQILALLGDRQFTRALSIYRGLERDSRDRQIQCTEFFGEFIQSAIRVGKIDVVEKLVFTLQRNRVTMSVEFWRTALRMLSSRKHFGACISIYAILGDELPLDKVVYSCLINAAMDCGKDGVAAVMLKRYAQCDDLEPKDHILFFRTYANLTDVEGAELVFRKLGTQMNNLMFNLLLNTCVKAQEPERALKFLVDAQKLSPSVPFVDAVSYNTVMKGFMRIGCLSQAFELLHEMRGQGIEPDDVTFATLLDASLKDSDVDSVRTMIDRLLEGDKLLDPATCTVFIKGLVRANCLPKALEIYHDVQRRVGSSDLAACSVLIKALVDSHDVKQALSIVADMKAAGLAPDDMIYTHLLDGCRHAGDLELGKEIFGEMVAAGLEPSEYTLIALIKLLGRCGAHVEAHEVVRTWEAKFQCKPSVIHYTCLISSSLRSKQYEQAWSAYELMVARSITPDAAVFTTLLPALVVIQDWTRVLILVKQAAQGPTAAEVPSEMLKNALNHMKAHNAYGPAGELESLLLARNYADRRHGQ